MNVTCTNNSPCIVVSKYFSSNPVMDESLTEFKEKKGSCKGPKNSQKPVNIVKPKKKLPKRIKGQKDIRSALKSKNNEQLTYAKEFDEVCKQAGVDIDPEQLQLAVALSRSLHSADDNEGDTSQKPLNSQERSKKIRATLKEYGFAVPEIKQTNKSKKKLRKKYKLLLLTETEKQQIVSDRYAQVLFRNACNSKATNSHDFDYSLKNCYYVATEITYMSMQNNSKFYVGDLVERSTSKGSLLRDWAGIPGRPESPIKKETINMNISEIECSQEELDIVLSGTLKSAKDIVRNKVDSKPSNTSTIVFDIDNTNPEFSKPKVDDKSDKTLVNSKSMLNTKSMDVSANKTLFLSDRVRSCSPDIFDDEVSLIIDIHTNTENNIPKTKENVIMDLTDDDNDNLQSSQNINEPIKDRNNFVIDLAQTENNENNNNTDSSRQNLAIKSIKPIPLGSQESNFTRRNSHDFMEITECVDISALKTDDQNISKLSLGTNKPRRYSDELMEVIECVAISCSQINSNEYNLQAIKSQIANTTKRKSNDLMEMTECVASTSHCVPLEVEANIDLTQNSDEDSTNVAGGIVNNILDKIDLSQSSNSCDELPKVQMTESNKSLDDTIILNNDEIVVNNPPKSSVKTVMSEICLMTTAEHTLDLTETPPSPSKAHDNDKSSNKSFFDDFFYNHSDDTNKETLEKSIATENCDSLSKESHDSDEVDLTQSSNSSVVNVEQNSKNCSLQIIDSLGKNHDLSIDYDEMYDVIVNTSTDVSKKKDGSKSSVIYEKTDENDAETESENINRSSQEFDISDKELEYSLNQSRHEPAWRDNYDGISVINGNLSVRDVENNFENERDVPDTSMSESFLPIVKVKSNINMPSNLEDRFKTPVTIFSKEKAVTPFKAFVSDNAVTIDTPTCNEYIVKTDQVTPILDYASMSTPERNKELGKYGLKPFKRKRAIQLLTHLYNQTHPIVDSCQEDLPSPSKKRKHSEPSPKKLESPKKSPRKLKLPRTLIKSPKNTPEPIDWIDDNRENNVYELTNELPEIKAIECSEEDWVFQKREKAKIHSCRVPLHVALHNYLSCRRRLREAILRYEPVNIDVIHKELVASGHRYDPKDLLKYLDKKCITVKTADNNARNNKN